VLAVEIAGEDEEERVLRDKALWYLEHGVAVVWLVLPETREVLVIMSSGEKRFGRADRVDAHEMLPGLEPEVARLFAQLDRD
jgi:Uma2 family endonuclease